MNQIKVTYKKFEKTLSSMKFAVVIISIFTIALIFGTFMESFHGADYANRMVYKSYWFMFIEVLMFLSIFMAVVVRLPPKKRLYGFYTIHAGLMILFAGSLFTYINGIDGSIQIIPNTPAKKIIINTDFLKVTFNKLQKSYKLQLPYTHKERNLDIDINQLKVLKFLPYAENITIWKDQRGFNPQLHSSEYQIFNEMTSQKFVLSLDPNSDFKSTVNMGPLSVHYMPVILETCFTKESASNLIIWNLQTSDCYTPEEKSISVEKTDKGTRFLVINDKNKFLKFFPDFSPVAVKDDLTKDTNSPYRVLSRKVFEQKPNLFLFGKKLAYFNKRKKKWKLTDITSSVAKLPWMGFKVRLLRHEINKYPLESPQYVKPIHDNGQLVKGKIKAVLVQLNKQTYWVRNDAPIEVTDGKESIRLQIAPKELTLPYEITLEKFKMNMNPGTKDPASYESFVSLLDGRTTKGLQKFHVFMNNPLKYDDFTFYQSSYFPIGPNNQYGSVLSVNYDPGRFFKYFGSLLIVLGSIWHYILNRKKTKVNS